MLHDVNTIIFYNFIELSSWHNNVKVTKGGIGAYLYDYSKEHSFLYGIFAALGAILLGFTASEIFRRMTQF